MTDWNQPPEPGETPPHGAPVPPPYWQPHQPAYPPTGAHGYAVGPYAYGPGGQPSEKSKVTAGLLQLLLPFVGVPGVGRLYLGHTGLGLAQLLGAIISYVLICAIVGLFTMWGFLLWSIIDGIVILASDTTRDGEGRLLR